MSDSEKHFDPTPSRLAKARRDGNVPRAQEFGANAAFAAAALAAVAIAAPLAQASTRAFAAGSRGDVGPAGAIFAIALLPLVAAALAAVLAGVVQTQGLVFVAPAIRLERLAPVEGIKRIFSRETVTHALRAVVAFAIAAASVSSALRDILATTASVTSPLAIAFAAWHCAERIAATGVCIGLVLAGIEVAVARRGWIQKLKMSLHELKRDVKEQDGDPMTRGRRASLHRSMIRGSLQAVRDAAFVVVNPTHVAVALEYRPPEVPVPVVLLRALDAMALHVRDLARESNVPVVENVSLARALYREGRTGEPIPREHYVAVAEVVAALVRSGAL